MTADRRPAIGLTSEAFSPGAERARNGQYYQRPEWQQNGNDWRLNRGGWQHGQRQGDRDRDGIPNRVDRDRDGDGVPNRQDSNPNNPRRN